jgi:hypothetical protein
VGGRGFNAIFPVGEQVNVQCGARRHAMGEQGIAAAKGEPVLGRGGQRDAGDLPVQIA